MSELARPIFLPLTDVSQEAVEAARSGLTTVAPIFVAGAAAANPIQLSQRLTKLTADAAETLAARSHEAFCEAMKDWGRDLVALAEVVLAPIAAAGVVGAELVEALAVEILRIKFLRLAAMLSLAGVIVDDPGLGSRFNWEKLRDFLVSTADLVDEKFWDDIFDTADLDLSGRMPALLAALLVVAPQTISALHSGRLEVAPLEPPPTAIDAHPAWQQLRANSTGWVPVTFPLRLLNGQPGLSDFLDLRGGFDPELAISMLVRSRRRPSAGRTVTDFEVWLHPSVDAASYSLRTSAEFVAQMEPGVRLGFGYDGGTKRWNARIEPRPASPVAATTNEAVLRIGRDRSADLPDLLIGAPYDTRVVARDVSLELRLRQLGEPSVELVGRLDGFAVVLTNRWFRSLGESESSLREGLRFDLDLEARLSEGTGFNLAADGALTVRREFNKKFDLRVLDLTVHSVLVTVPVRADQDHFDIRAEIRAHWSAKIGPAIMVVDGAGGWVGWWADQPGDEKHCVGLLPPTAIGLELELPGVSGGGLLDFTGGPNDRYGGLLSVTIGPKTGLSRTSITAFGLHELTGSPSDTSRGRSLILVLGASFRPGLALGFGIFWIGAGGLIGVNRRADADALRERLTAGAVGNILFAEDPIRNAPVLLGDLAALFPAKAGTHILGLTLQLGWIPLVDDYLARLAVGVLVEFTSDRIDKVIVLGSLRLSNPTLKKVLDVQVDVAGVVDLVRHTLEIDATIRRGVVMGLFTLTGDGGVRASWGEQRYLMATLGGFHPDFNPQPAVFPSLKRVLLTIDKSRLPDSVELSASGYLAVTSSTLQFGGEFTAAIKAGKWKIEGKIGGDAIIRLLFAFDLSLHGGVHVKYRGHSLIGVTFKGGLRGPSPLVLRGEVCVSLLFFDACWSDSFELGRPGAVTGPLLASLVPVLAQEIARPANLSVGDIEDDLVLLARREGSTRVVLSPLGRPAWAQQRLPLGLPIETFEGGHLDRAQRLDVRTTALAAPRRDWFSPGSFVELSEAEEMALPAFERHRSGVEIELEISRSAPVPVEFEIEEIRLPETRRTVPGTHLPADVLDRMLATAEPAAIRPRPPRITVRDGQFRMVGDPGAGAELSATAAHLAARNGRQTSQHVADRLVTVTV